MATNQNFLRYEENIKYEIYGSPYINAKDIYDDVHKEIKSESQLVTGFITVKEYSKDLKNKQKKYRA